MVTKYETRECFMQVHIKTGVFWQASSQMKKREVEALGGGVWDGAAVRKNWG